MLEVKKPEQQKPEHQPYEQLVLQFLNQFSTGRCAQQVTIPWTIRIRIGCYACDKLRILALSNTQPLSPNSMWSQMCSTPLPGLPDDCRGLLWNRYQIVVPVFEWNGRTLIRVSIQAYNTPEDIDRLLDGLETIGKER